MIVLTALEKDALAEAFNVALGAASATFAEVVQTEVQMSVPAVDLLTREELIARLASLPDSAANRKLVSIAQDFASGIDIETARYVTNDYIAGANDFDKTKVHADADAYALPEDLAAIDMADVEAKFYANVIN